MDGRYTGERVLGLDERKEADLSNQASREMTVAEFIDSKIKEHKHTISMLEDFRGSLPVSYLSSGCLRISWLGRCW